MEIVDAALTSDEYERHIGQGVAVRDQRVLVGSTELAAVVRWLKDRNEAAEVVFYCSADDDKVWM